MPESASGAASERTEVGSYFVANYPPFSVWTKQAVDEDARPALASSPAPGIPLGLYLHIPFCRKRCHFCYFRVYTDKNARDVATTSTRSSSRASRAAFNEGVDRMRRLVCEYYDGFSFGRFVKNFPELRGKVTDLLIGDLFTDKVDVVWQPMESLYEPGKQPIPRWNTGVPVDQTDGKHNELILPEGRRP